MASDSESGLERALAHFPAHRPPDVLYRFFGEAALSSFTEGKLRLTPPSEFNDPFEIYAGLSEDGLTEEAVLRSVLTKGGLFRCALEAKYPNSTLPVGYEEVLIAAVKQRPDLWRLHLKTQVDAISSSCAESFGISCFSGFTMAEICGEVGIHHWAMYGGQHRGFAVGYRGDHEFLANCAAAKWLFPTEYVERRHTVDVSYFDDWNDDKMWRTLRGWSAIKSRQAWGHEREWRLMLPINADHPMPGYSREAQPDGRVMHFINLWAGSRSHEEMLFRSNIIGSITLGARVSPKLVSEVLNASTQPHLRHVEVWRVTASDREYALVPERLA